MEQEIRKLWAKGVCGMNEKKEKTIPQEAPGPQAGNGLFILMLITAAAALYLRVRGLTFQSLWLDELVTCWTTRPGQSLSCIIDFCRDSDFNPPFFYLLLWTWQKVFGAGELIVRLVPAITGTLGVVAVYFLGRELFSARSGVYGALLTALLSFHLYYSQEVRCYSLMFLACTLSFLFMVRLLKNFNRSCALSYTFITIVMNYTHYYGLFIFVFQFLFCLVFFFAHRATRRRDFLVSVFPSLLCIALSYLPWLPVLVKLNRVKDFWIPAPAPDFFVSYFIAYFGQDPFVILLSLVLIVLYLSGRSREREFWGHKFLLLGWVIVLLVIPYCRSLGRSHPSPLYIRYTIVILPSLLLMAGRGIERIRNVRYQYVVLLPMLVMLVTTIFFYSPGNYYRRVTKEQWREAALYIIQEDRKARYPVYASPLSEYYFKCLYRYPGVLKPPIETMTDADNVCQEVISRQIPGFWLYEAHNFTGNDIRKSLDEKLQKARFFTLTGASVTLYLPKPGE
jgi:uncharacterized membrane protein